MYALRHSSVKNLWFHRDLDRWTLKTEERATFTSSDEANDVGVLLVNSFDGFTIVRIV